MAGSVKMGVAVVVSAVDRVTGPLQRISARAATMQTRLTSLRVGADAVFRSTLKIGAAAVAAAGAATYAVVRMGKAWLDAAGNLQDFGAQIGWRVEDIQAWRYAAGQAGVTSGDFDKAIQRMSKNLAELRTGSGQLYSLLKRVGDRKFLKQLEGATGGEALDLIIRKMEMLGDQEMATLLATQVFGRSGLVMTGLAAQGSPALELLRQRAYELGIVLSQDAANAADDAGDKLLSLRQTVEGLGNRIMVQLLPHIDNVIDRTTAWVEANGPLLAQNIAEWVEGIGNKFVDALPKAMAFFDKVQPALELMLTVAEGIAWTLGKVGWVVGQAKAGIEALAGGLASGVDTIFDGTGQRESEAGRKASEMDLQRALRDRVDPDALERAQREVYGGGMSPSDPQYWSRVASVVASNRMSEMGVSTQPAIVNIAVMVDKDGNVTVPKTSTQGNLAVGTVATPAGVRAVGK